jgi:aspartate carbamoyltransferase catalytic subunit
VISSASAATDSSLAKGESIEDCIKTVQEYADLIVMRHPHVGSAARAAAVSRVPFINAGDGIGEHPSQTLLDRYTISARLKRTSDLKIAIVGDLYNGRTTHSLIKNLSNDQSNQFYFVSPPQLAIPDYLRDRLIANGSQFTEASCYRDFLPEIDVYYMTRIQREYMDEEEYEKCKGIYTLGIEEASIMKHDSIIMHPLPRVDEISIAVDEDHRCAYFDQVRNGLYVRMALLKVLLAK